MTKFNPGDHDKKITQSFHVPVDSVGIVSFDGRIVFSGVKNPPMFLTGWKVEDECLIGINAISPDTLKEKLSLLKGLVL